MLDRSWGFKECAAFVDEIVTVSFDLDLVTPKRVSYERATLGDGHQVAALAFQKVDVLQRVAGDGQQIGKPPCPTTPISPSRCMGTAFIYVAQRIWPQVNAVLT